MRRYNSNADFGSLIHGGSGQLKYILESGVQFDR